MIENVFGLAYRNQSAPFFKALVTGLRRLGYSVTHEYSNAADYGVPQNRQRLFIVGSRDGSHLRLPAPTHWGEHERRRPPTNLDELLPHVSARAALVGSYKTRPEPEESVNGKYGHLLPEIPPGRNYLHYTAHEGHPKPLFDWRSRYWTFLLKLDPRRPAPTIQAALAPTLVRSTGRIGASEPKSCSASKASLTTTTSQAHENSSKRRWATRCRLCLLSVWLERFVISKAVQRGLPTRAATQDDRRPRNDREERR